MFYDITHSTLLADTWKSMESKDRGQQSVGSKRLSVGSSTSITLQRDISSKQNKGFGKEWTYTFFQRSLYFSIITLDNGAPDWANVGTVSSLIFALNCHFNLLYLLFLARTRGILFFPVWLILGSNLKQRSTKHPSPLWKHSHMVTFPLHDSISQ